MEHAALPSQEPLIRTLGLLAALIIITVPALARPGRAHEPAPRVLSPRMASGPAPGCGGEDPPRSPAERNQAPAERYQELVKEYSLASAEFRKAASDDERNRAVERLSTFPARFVDLAAEDFGDPAAVSALVEAVRALNAVDSLTQTAWEMNTQSFPAVRRDDAAARAAQLLLRDHLRSEKIALICERMTYGIRKEYDAFLRAVLKANPHRDVRGIACLALARLLASRAHKLGLVADRPELAARYSDLLGRDEFAALEREGRARILKDVEALLEEAAAEFADVKLPYGGTVGENARRELTEIRDLAVGREAPDIEGMDQDGVAFKLRDYRGQVVLLDFWQEH
jgi:hypothetical protein